MRHGCRVRRGTRREKQRLLLQSLHIVINMSPTCKDAVSLSLGQNSVQTMSEIKFKKRGVGGEKKHKESKGQEGRSWYFILSQSLLPEEDVTGINSHLPFGDGRTDPFASRVCSKSALELEGERPSPHTQSFAFVSPLRPGLSGSPSSPLSPWVVLRSTTCN